MQTRQGPEQGVNKRVEALENWIRAYTGGSLLNAIGFSLKELEGRLLKRTESLESQFVQLNTQELPSRQRELESRVDKLSQNDVLPSFGASMNSGTSGLETRMKEIENKYENLVNENARLTTRMQKVEELRNSTTIKQVTTRLDNVIRVVNDHGRESYQLQQAMQDMQQVVDIEANS